MPKPLLKLLPLFLLFLFASSFHFASAAVIQKQPNNLGLVGYWPLNEGTGTQAGDFSGYGNTGTLSGTTLPSWVSGKRGNALSFDGSTSKITLSNSASFNSLTGSFTISHWIKTTSALGQMYTVSNAGGGNGYRFGLSGGVVAFLVGDNSGYTETTCGSKTFNDGKWHLITGVFSRSGTNQFTCYGDGVLIANVSLPQSYPVMQTNAPGIAIPPCCQAFNGSLDDIRIYNRALSATEVAYLYNSGAVVRKQVSNNGMVGYWSMDEGRGTTVGDSSGNGYTGTFTGSPSWVDGKRGKALSISNSNYVTTPNINLANMPYTVSAWIYRNDTNDFNIVGGGAGGGNANAHYIIRSNHAYFGNYGCDLGGNATINANQWYLITFVMDSGQNKSIYVNGVLDAGPSNSCGYYQSYVNEIGLSCCGGAGLGTVDDVRIYNRALSATEIAKLYAQNETNINHSQNSRLTSGLVGFWSFNGADVSGTTAYDRSGSGLNATISGGKLDIGKVGQGFTFLSASDQVYTGSTSILDTDTHTISFWLRLNANSTYWGQIFAFRPSGTDRSPGIWAYAGANCIHWRYDPGNSGPTSCGGPGGESTYFNLGQWYHIAGVKNGGTFTFYVNGSAVESGGVSSPKASGPSTINMGQTGYSAPMASIDELRVYNRALSASEVQQLYLMGK